MPISIEEYSTPKWIRYREGYTVARQTNKRSIFINFSDYPRSYRGGDFPQPGYNPNHQSVRTERVNLYNDNITLKSR
jgi:hypothetical protein